MEGGLTGRKAEESLRKPVGLPATTSSLPGMLRPALLLCALIAHAGALEGPARDQARAELRALAAESGRLSRAFNLVHELVGPSVVSIHTSARVVQRTWTGLAVREVEAGEGSGFVVASEGGQSWILTNAHVVLRSDQNNGFVKNRDGSWAGYDRLRVVLHDNRETEATYVGVDVQTDLALIRVTFGDLPPAVWADSDQTKVGDWVLALGYPLGVGYSASAGIVSATDRSTGIYEAVGGFESFIQTDTAINPGNSGGPLVDLQARIIGVNANIKSSTGVNIGLGFAIPANLARRVAEDLRAHGEVKRGVVGVRLDDLTAAEAVKLGLPPAQAVRIDSVDPFTPAEKAGVKGGDVILTVDGGRIASSQQFRARLAVRRPGEPFQLGLWRNGTPVEITLRIADRADIERQLHEAAQQLIAKGIAAPAFGFTLLADGPAAAGLLIVAIEADSLAERAGLSPGDRVLAEATLGKLSTTEHAQALAALREASIQVQRGTRKVWLRLRG